MGSVISAIVGGGAADEPPAADVPPADHVITFRSKDRWDLHLEASRERDILMVIDFSASWCGPCKMMDPMFKAMSCRLTHVEFVMLDVDEVPEVAKEYGVKAMPTFVLVKGGKEVTRVLGAKKDVDLEKIILEHSLVHTS